MRKQLSLSIIGWAMLAGCQHKQIEADNSKLVGEWSLFERYGYIGYSLSEAWQKQVGYYGYVFREDNRFLYDYLTTANVVLPTGKYMVDGNNQVNITISGDARTYLYSFNGDTLLLSDLAPQTSAFWKYKLVR